MRLYACIHLPNLFIQRGLQCIQFYDVLGAILTLNPFGICWIFLHTVKKYIYLDLKVIFELVCNSCFKTTTKKKTIAYSKCTLCLLNVPLTYFYHAMSRTHVHFLKLPCTAPSIYSVKIVFYHLCANVFARLFLMRSLFHSDGMNISVFINVTQALSVHLLLFIVYRERASMQASARLPCCVCAFMHVIQIRFPHKL